jgi:hypothetical protein
MSRKSKAAHPYLDGGVGCGHVQVEARLEALVRLGVVAGHLGDVHTAASDRVMNIRSEFTGAYAVFRPFGNSIMCSEHSTAIGHKWPGQPDIEDAGIPPSICVWLAGVPRDQRQAFAGMMGTYEVRPLTRHC